MPGYEWASPSGTACLVNFIFNLGKAGFEQAVCPTLFSLAIVFLLCSRYLRPPGMRIHAVQKGDFESRDRKPIFFDFLVNPNSVEVLSVVGITCNDVIRLAKSFTNFCVCPTRANLLESFPEQAIASIEPFDSPQTLLRLF